jgi:hypothetical protein
MRTRQKQWKASSGWQDRISGARAFDAHDAASGAQWIIAFGDGKLLADSDALVELAKAYPTALIVGCSTAGEILDTEVFDGSLVATIVDFDHTQLRLAQASISAAQQSHEVGAALAAQLLGPELQHVMVLSDGLSVNGTTLVSGLREHLPPDVAVTGGLAGDSDRFQHTFVYANGVAREQQVIAIGFYGTSLRVGYGSLGGWDSFGPERLITRAEGNVLYEVDGRSALGLYKEYLGEHAAGLPATALLFPLALRSEHGDYSLVRTVLAIDEDAGSMTFAGDMPQGSYARLMKANFDRLIDGAAEAARGGLQGLHGFAPELAILISCVGRKLLLKQRVEEEVESVREVLGASAAITGFYSYGEICPHGAIQRCELHNQTMTITTFAETTADS